MSKGNDIHEALFDNEAINLSVKDAVEMAGDEFGVHFLKQQLMDSYHKRQCAGIANECSLYKC